MAWAIVVSSMPGCIIRAHLCDGCSWLLLSCAAMLVLLMNKHTLAVHAPSHSIHPAVLRHSVWASSTCGHHSIIMSSCRPAPPCW
jgi:hypothetical protein